MSDTTIENDAHATALQTVREDEVSRRKFLKLAGGASAIGALGILFAACGDDKESKSSGGTSSSDNDKMDKTDKKDKANTSSGNSGDLAIVNYALTLEHIEADFYQAVIDSGLFKGAELEMIKVIGEHEAEHVQALEGTANKLGEAVEKPKTTFPLESREAILTLAATVENVGAAAYLGQAGMIVDPEILAAALAIHSVEARHAAALNTLTGKPFTPDGAFAKPMSMEEVLPLVKPFLAA